jgi:hypothetical protein
MATSRPRLNSTTPQARLASSKMLILVSSNAAIGAQTAYGPQYIRSRITADRARN